MTYRYDSVDPSYAQWWISHLRDEPLVIVRCARDKPRCGKGIGEIKREGDHLMALRKMVRPGPTTPAPERNWTAQTSTELEERKAERSQHVLKRFEGEDGVPMEVMRRRGDLAPAVGLLEWWPSYFCPKHGEISVDSGDLAKFVAKADDTQSIDSRTYWARGDVE
jgi:hypothetical protein